MTNEMSLVNLGVRELSDQELEKVVGGKKDRDHGKEDHDKDDKHPHHPHHHHHHHHHKGPRP